MRRIRPSLSVLLILFVRPVFSPARLHNEHQRRDERVVGCLRRRFGIKSGSVFCASLSCSFVAKIGTIQLENMTTQFWGKSTIWQRRRPAGASSSSSRCMIGVSCCLRCNAFVQLTFCIGIPWAYIKAMPTSANTTCSRTRLHSIRTQTLLAM